MQKNKAQIFSRLCSFNHNCSSLYLSLLPACPGSTHGHGAAPGLCGKQGLLHIAEEGMVLFLFCF